MEDSWAWEFLGYGMGRVGLELTCIMKGIWVGRPESTWTNRRRGVTSCGRRG